MCSQKNKPNTIVYHLEITFGCAQHLVFIYISKNFIKFVICIFSLLYFFNERHLFRKIFIL